MAQKHVRTDYPEIMRVIGFIIQREHLSEVTITEFDRGWIIAGLTFKSTAYGFIRVPSDYVLSFEEINTLGEELRQQRQGAAKPKRGWLR